MCKRIADELSIENVKKQVEGLQFADPYTQWRPRHISNTKGDIDSWMDLPESFLKMAEKYL